MNVTNYIDRIAETYRKAHPQYMELATRKDAVIKELAELPYNKLLSDGGKAARRKSLEKDLESVKQDIKALYDTTTAKFCEVKVEYAAAQSAKVKEDFEAIEAKQIELINSGCLKLAELTNLAERYNNPILSRLIAKAIIAQYAGDMEAEKTASMLEHADSMKEIKEAKAIEDAVMWATLGVGGTANQFIDRTGAEASYAASMNSYFDDAIASIKDSLKEA